ncbi:helix-turn-helix domain-containing protein [Yinghuangia sp. YIM S09857]|uniref:helix-turn-helix domain-containing protein n=1 Tax=Yinghuangia sp. YIM S09857 TaxID=3436929 RepID=UPI003F52E969
MRNDVDERLARRLTALRVERTWSLDELAGRTGVSRSTLSRLERAEISPTAALLNKLCAAYGRTMSRLLAEVESDTEPVRVLRADEQPVWTDRASGFVRRSVSPPHPDLRAEIVEGELGPGAHIAYDGPPTPGLEHHIRVADGTLAVTVEGVARTLTEGDAMSFRLWGASAYANPGDRPVRYTLVVVAP